MELNRLFELIRSGNCILWAGAGLSKYAGFPLGSQIADFLNGQLQENKRPNGALLKDVASLYEKVFGRDILIEQIRNHFFNNPPASYKYHDIISKIPHFKTILTTNFDPLFELAYGNRLIKVVSPLEIIKIPDKKTILIKVHGDFFSPQHLVLTDDDYVRYLNETTHSLLYNYILTQLAVSNVVFLGYSFGDLNALALFNRINLDLGAKRKEWFLISPGQKSFDIDYFRTKNITCFNLTGEEFIEQLEKHLNQNIISDLQKGHDAGLITEYLHQRELLPTIEFRPDGQKLRELKTLADKAAHVHFSFKTSSDIGLKLKKLQLGLKSNISLNDVDDFRMEVNGVFMSQLKSPISLQINSGPVHVQQVALHFNNEMIENVKMQVSQSKKEFAFKLTYDNLKLKIGFKMPMTENKSGLINISLGSTYKELSNAFSIVHFILHASEGKTFELVRDSNKMPLQFVPNDQIHNRMSNTLAHFKHLEIIENYYKIRFQNFIVTAEGINQARRLAGLILGETLPYENINGTFNRSEVNLTLLKKINDENSMIRLEIIKPEPLILYGMEFDLNNMIVEVYDTIVKNLEDYLEQKTNELSFESKSRRVKAQIHKQLNQ